MEKYVYILILDTVVGENFDETDYRVLDNFDNAFKLYTELKGIAENDILKYANINEVDKTEIVDRSNEYVYMSLYKTGYYDRVHFDLKIKKVELETNIDIEKELLL